LIVTRIYTPKIFNILPAFTADITAAIKKRIISIKLYFLQHSIRGAVILEKCVRKTVVLIVLALLNQWLYLKMFILKVKIYNDIGVVINE